MAVVGSTARVEVGLAMAVEETTAAVGSEQVRAAVATDEVMAAAEAGSRSRYSRWKICRRSYSFPRRGDTPNRARPNPDSENKSTRRGYGAKSSSRQQSLLAAED